MVMFRDFTCRNARKLGLVGTVQNLSDGSVYVVAEGEKEKLQKILKLLRSGSLFSKVDDVKDVFLETKGGFTEFNIVY